MPRRLWLFVSIVSLLLAATTYAQFGFRGNFYRVPPRLPQAETFDGRFNFCRLMYRSWYREAGGQGVRAVVADDDGGEGSGLGRHQVLRGFPPLRWRVAPKGAGEGSAVSDKAEPAPHPPAPQAPSPAVGEGLGATPSYRAG